MWLLRRFSPNRLLAVTGATLVWLTLTGNVLAAEHDHTNSAFNESPLPFLFTVYTITWAAFFAYAFYVNRRQRELRREIEELRKASEDDTSRSYS